MKCPKCGNSVAQNARFCGVCGTAIPTELEQNSVTNVNTASRKPLPTKKLMLFGGVATVAVVAIVFLANVLKPSNYVLSEGAAFFVQQNEDGTVITHTGGSTATYEGAYASRFNGSLNPGNGSVAITNSADEPDDLVTTFYYISEDGIKAFADADGEGGVHGVVSADGNAVVFASGIQYEYASGREEGELRIFDGDKAQTISSEFYPSGNFCVSPDGKTVVYTADYDGEEYTTYIWNNGKSSELGENLIPIAVSNGGKLIYFGDNEKLYVQRGDNKTRLTSAEDINIAYFNKDNSEILFGTYDKTYLCVNGDERFSLDGSLNSLLLPTGVNVAYSAGYQIVNANIGSFENVFYTTDSGVYRITEDHESERAARANDAAMLADDGETIFYLNSGAVYSINGFDTSAQAKRIVDDSVSYFDISGNGNTIHYLTDEGELYYQKGDAEPKLIDYDLQSSSNQFAVHDQSNTVFYINDGELFSSKSGEKASIVSAVDDDNLTIVAGSMLISVYDENYEQAYWSADGATFKPVDTQ